ALPVTVMDVLAPEGAVIGRKLIIVIPNVGQESRIHRYRLLRVDFAPGKSNAAAGLRLPVGAAGIPTRAHRVASYQYLPRSTSIDMRRCFYCYGGASVSVNCRPNLAERGSSISSGGLMLIRLNVREYAPFWPKDCTFMR